MSVYRLVTWMSLSEKLANTFGGLWCRRESPAKAKRFYLP